MDAPPPPQPPDDRDNPVAMAHYQNLLKKYSSDSLRRSRSAARNQNNTSPVSTLKPREILDAVDGNSEGIGATSASAMLDFADAGADVLVAGSFVFKSQDPIATIHELKNA